MCHEWASCYRAAVFKTAVGDDCFLSAGGGGDLLRARRKVLTPGSMGPRRQGDGVGLAWSQWPFSPDPGRAPWGRQVQPPTENPASLRPKGL